MTDPGARILARILAAPVYGLARESELSPAPGLTSRTGHRVSLKREDLQPTFSFKLRGASAKLASLDAETSSRGVIAASAGNHAQGVALAARQAGVEATIVMPTTTPAIKVRAVEALGARIELVGDDYDTAARHAEQLAKRQGATLMHPFDDPDVIAGQGTIGLELLRQCPSPPEAVFVPVGGGGLLAGIAVAIKASAPNTRIIGVESEDAASMQRALAAGGPVTLDRVGGFADGTAVRRVGALTYALAAPRVDQIIVVDADEICAAIRDIFEDTRTLVEPSGALAVAGLKRYAREDPAPGQHLVAINSGANVNFDRLAHVVERSAYGAGEEALLSVVIPERPGAFLQLCRDLGRLGVTEFNYRYGDPESARVFLGVRLAGAECRDAVLARLSRAGYPVRDLTDNDLARAHVRHLVGGCLPSRRREVLYRIQFPERPGALEDFLTALGDRWNISLFHYRNHGAAYGRVLVGLMVPEADQHRVSELLDTSKYVWTDESDNPVYRDFLGRAPGLSKPPLRVAG